MVHDCEKDESRTAPLNRTGFLYALSSEHTIYCESIRQSKGDDIRSGSDRDVLLIVKHVSHR